MSTRRGLVFAIPSAWLLACYIGGGGMLPKPDGAVDASSEASADAVGDRDDTADADAALADAGDR